MKWEDFEEILQSIRDRRTREYLRKRIVPDLKLLSNAIEQQGAWSRRGVCVTPDWYLETMQDRIRQIDWDEARADVIRFITARELGSLSAWNADLFLQQMDQLISLFA
jgi:hypothetical protein